MSSELKSELKNKEIAHRARRTPMEKNSIIYLLSRIIMERQNSGERGFWLERHKDLFNYKPSSIARILREHSSPQNPVAFLKKFAVKNFFSITTDFYKLTKAGLQEFKKTKKKRR